MNEKTPHSVSGFQVKAAKYVEKLIEGLARAAWVLLVLMMLVGVADVVLGFFGLVVPGLIPWIQTLNVMVVSLPLLYVTSQKRHVVMDLLTGKLGGRAKRWADVTVLFLTFLFCTVLAWQLSISAWRSTRIMEFELTEIHVYLFPARIMLAIGFVGAGGVLVAQIVGECRRRYAIGPSSNSGNFRKEGEPTPSSEQSGTSSS
jgi:TRAP-type mannitol/chloroaromatic compound transport system permease small subunit